MCESPSAWAGNSHRALFDPVTQAVHPRVGGEQFERGQQSGHVAGSSPRGRGTAVALVPEPAFCRFIPAWAGNRQEDAA